MTAAALTPSAEYLENGVTLAFPAPFRYDSTAHLVVERIDSGVATALALGVDFNATPGPTDAGGTVTLVATVAGKTLRIRRSTPRAQNVDYPTNGTFPAESHEAALDRQMLIAQEQDVTIAELTDRALLVPVGKSAPPVADLTGGDGKVLGIVAGEIVPVDSDPVAVAGAVLAAQTAAATSTEKAGIATIAAADALEAEAGAQEAQALAEIAAGNAALVTAAGLPYPNAYAATLPKGVTSIAITNPGAGGAAGTYALGVAGGPTGFAGTYTIAGGVVTAITITNPGLATGAGAPVLSFPSGGIAGAAATATVSSLIPDQKAYWVASADSSQILLYVNNGGAAAAAPLAQPQLVLYGKAAQDALLASVRTAAAKVAAGIGAVAAASASTIGATGATANLAAGFITFCGDLVQADSGLDRLDVNWSAAATFDVLVVDAISRKVRNVVTGFAGAGGAQSFDSPLGAFVLPANSLVGVRRTAGAGLLKAGAAGTVSPRLNDAAYAIGDTVPAFGNWGAGNIPAISLNLSTVADALDGRVDALERPDPALTSIAAGEVSESTKALVIGQYGLAVSNQINSPFMPGLTLRGDCKVNGAKINCNAAGSGFLELWRAVDGAWKLTHRKFVTVAIGDNTLSAPGWPANAGSILAYRIYTGSGPTYKNGGIPFVYVAAPTADEIGDTISTFAQNTGGTLNFQALVSVPARRSHRATRAATSGPTTFEFQQFTGASAPKFWAGTGTGNFSVNNGLLASGAGGWDKIATWQPNGGGYSSINKRRLIGRVVINDATSIVGICTQPRSSVGGDGGAVVMIDGTANKLRLYHWTGGAGAGALYTDIALTAALTAGRAYTLSVQRDGWTITAVLTDTVDGTQTTLTTATANQAGRPRLHGRPGVVHISGDVKWEWLRFAHDTPRNVKAVFPGDSNGEGTALGGGDSWITQLNASYGGIVNACRAGEVALDMAARLTDLADLRPQIVGMCMGTNDTDQTNWRIGVKESIDQAELIGAEPVLATPPPYVAKQAFITAIAADITGGYFGRYRYIDLLGALSNNNDRLTWNPALVSGDGIHMNAAGQTRAKVQAIADIPELAY